MPGIGAYDLNLIDQGHRMTSRGSGGRRRWIIYNEKYISMVIINSSSFFWIRGVCPQPPSTCGARGISKSAFPRFAKWLYLTLQSNLFPSSQPLLCVLCLMPHISYWGRMRTPQGQFQIVPLCCRNHQLWSLSYFGLSVLIFWFLGLGLKWFSTFFWPKNFYRDLRPYDTLISD